MLLNATFSDVVNALSIIFAVAALVISSISIAMNVRLSKQQRASQIIKDYLYLELTTSKGAGRDDLKVAFMLLMAKEVFAAYPHNEMWRGLMMDQFVYYRKTLLAWQDKSPDYVAHYGSHVAQFVADVIKKGPGK